MFFNMSLQQIVISIPGVVIGFAFHEFAHAWVATWFGDDTPRHQGRVTLNPAAHLDLWGTLLLLFAGFGWAKPVQVDLARLRPRVLGDICVSLAGIVMNFLLAGLFFFLAELSRHGMLGYTHVVLTQTLSQVAYINLILVAINLLPVPPLDGFRVLRHLIPGLSHELLFNLYRFGPILLVILFVTGAAGYVIRPVLAGAMQAIVAVIGPLLRLILL